MDKLNQSSSISLTEEVMKLIHDHIPESRSDKIKNRPSLSCEIKEFVVENEEGKNVGVIVIYLPFVFYENNKATLPKIINEIQRKKNRYTFILAKRTIINKKEDFKQIIPRNRTLSAVYDSYLEDLIAPA